MSYHQSPLRYPGGKQRLAPFLAEILAANGFVGGDYAEPYAGGAGVAIDLLLGSKVARVHLNDSSRPVYAFWRSVLDHCGELCALVSSAHLNVEEWKRHREVVQRPAAHDNLTLGFSTLYLNRCNRSGVLSGGLIGGLQQTGAWRMDARFPKQELVRRIEAIARCRDRITVHDWDAEKFIQQYVPSLPARTLVYCDPPYYGNASRLYLDRYKKDDHRRLANVIQTLLCRPWVVSYDGAEEVLNYYAERRKFLYGLQYYASRSYQGQEVFIFSDDLALPSTSSLPVIETALRTNQATLQVGGRPQIALDFEAAGTFDKWPE